MQIFFYSSRKHLCHSQDIFKDFDSMIYDSNFDRTCTRLLWSLWGIHYQVFSELIFIRTSTSTLTLYVSILLVRVSITCTMYITEPISRLVLISKGYGQSTRRRWCLALSVSCQGIAGCSSESRQQADLLVRCVPCLWKKRWIPWK